MLKNIYLMLSRTRYSTADLRLYWIGATTYSPSLKSTTKRFVLSGKVIVEATLIHSDVPCLL